jgi:glutathione S-transferase
MADHEARLYGIPMSHPVIAVRGMLERKRMPYRYVELLAGAHPPSLWTLGFRCSTVPALRLPDGRRVQGSLAIAQALERTVGEPSLYPLHAEARGDAERAERWGEAVLQPVPRRLIRWGLRNDLSQRRWFADVASPLPAPVVTGTLMTPLAAIFARQAGADDEQIKRDLAELPVLLDEVERLLAAGVIGGDQPGAADFQIAASVRMLLAMQDVGRLVAGRPSEAFALALIPKYPPIPAALPPHWIPLVAASRSG